MAKTVKASLLGCDDVQQGTNTESQVHSTTFYFMIPCYNNAYDTWSFKHCISHTGTLRTDCFPNFFCVNIHAVCVSICFFHEFSYNPVFSHSTSYNLHSPGKFPLSKQIL